MSGAKKLITACRFINGLTIKSIVKRNRYFGRNQPENAAHCIDEIPGLNRLYILCDFRFYWINQNSESQLWDVAESNKCPCYHLL